MAMKAGSFIWMDGTFVPWDKAAVHPMSHTMQYGSGIFEGLRCFPNGSGTAIFRLQAHTDRLFQSAHLLQIEMTYTKEQLNEIQIAAVEKNGLRSAYIRPMVYYGAEHLGFHARNLQTHVMVAVFDMGEYIPKESPDEGIKLKTSSFNRIHPHTLLCKAKASGHYLNSMIAMKEAVAAGCDDALMVDAQGCVTEASTSNLFIVRKGVLYTPTEVGILEGITRDTVMQIARDLKMEMVVKNITRDEVYCCDEAFVTGTAADVKPLSAVDYRRIGSGKRGPITKRIQEAYSSIVSGADSKYSDWLSVVKM